MHTRTCLPRRSRSLALVLAGSASLVACGATGTSRTASEIRPRSETSSQFVVRGTDLERQPVGSIYDALMRLRPEFLQARHSTLEAPAGALPLVYLDDTYLGDISELRRLSPKLAREVRLLSNFDARERFGKVFPGSVIVVKTR